MTAITRDSLHRRIRSWFIAMAYHRQRWIYVLMKRLKQLEQAADAFLKIAKDAIIEFVNFANKIYELGAWKFKAPTWDAYCHERWNIGAARISQYRGAVPYAKAILEAGGNTPILESRIRAMKKHVPADSPLIAQTYALGAKVAAAMGQKGPTEGIFRRSLDVLQTAQETGGIVTVGETTYFIENEAEAVAAVQAVLGEVKRLAIDSATKQEIKVRAVRQKGGLWKLEAEGGGELPDEISFRVFIR